MINALEAMNALGALCVTLHEFPSSTLSVKISAGSFRASGGGTVAYAGTASLTLAASSTSSIYLTDAGVLTVSTSGFPSGSPIVRLATVVTSGTVVTSIVDARVSLFSSS